ncbi:MAG: segregation and condensation protein B [Candidatus Azotimanducaceae bacterium]|jgi:segregation and condensation protein B
MEGLPLKQIVEGAILASETALSIDQLMQLFEADPPERSEVRDVLQEIEEDFADRGFELKQVASGYRFQVRSDYSEWVSRLWKEKPPRYSRALLETLALVAYKQPITRGDIEDIRGVAVSTNIMRTLIEREWVRVVGHRDVPGHPALYATTKNFLDYFNLKSLDELPNLSEIKDLTKLNEELDLDEALIEIPRTIEIDDADSIDIEGVEDADLDAVSDQVNAIQQNIKNLYEPAPVEENLDDDLDSDQDNDLADEVDSSDKASTGANDAGSVVTGSEDEKSVTGSEDEKSVTDSEREDAVIDSDETDRAETLSEVEDTLKEMSEVVSEMDDAAESDENITEEDAVSEASVNNQVNQETSSDGPQDEDENSDERKNEG